MDFRRTENVELLGKSMKSFMEQTPNRDYLEIHLNDDEIENLPICGVCKKFYYLGNGEKKDKKLLDILIIPEDMKNFVPNTEWESEEDEFGKYF